MSEAHLTYIRVSLWQACMNLKISKQKEAFVLFFCGLILLTVYCFKSSIFQLLMQNKLEKLESIAGLYLILYALLFFILSSHSFLLGRNGKSIHKQVGQLLSEIWTTARRLLKSILSVRLSAWSWVWLIGFFLIGIIIRFYYSNQLMRSDEGATYYYFVSGSLYRSFIYLEPNNHVLHTLLARLSVFLFGNTPVFLRLPAILSGLICLPLIFVVARKLIGEKSGYASFAFMAVYPIVILFDTQARGYSMVNMLTLSGIYLVLSIIKNNSNTKQFLLALNCALGLFVMPSFLFQGLGLYLFLAISVCGQSKNCLWQLKKVILPAATLTILFTFILYTPVVLATGGFERIVANDTILPLVWENFISQTPDHFLMVFHRNTQGIPAWLSWIALTVSLFGVIWLFIKRKNKLLLLIMSMVLASVIVYFAKRSIPFPRTWLFFIPLAFMLVDAGYTAITDKLKNHYQTALAMGIGFAIGFVSLYYLPKNTLRTFNTFGTFEQSKELGNWLSDNLTDIDGLQLAYPTRYTTLYYMLQHHDFDKIHLLTNSNQANYFVIEKGSMKITNLTKYKVKKVFDLGDAVVFRRVDGLTIPKQ